ncbi:MAG TPA: flagellar basal body L-ring protein FlgH [Acidobacteria bacterium]|nr:flagellar basal body L-ring protein FlgH [Acidobacteriota bacterium]
MSGWKSHVAIVATLLALVAGMVGCASQPAAQPATYAGELPELEIPQQPRALSEGSLYVDGAAAELVGDFRARYVGDILTVRITESSLGKSSADADIKKNSKRKIEAPVLFGWENKLKGRLGPDFDPSLALQSGSSREFKGEGATSRAQTLTANLAVRVMAVGTGGRMLIAGTKKITVNRENQTIVLAGIVRPDDVLSDNTIRSSAIADLTIRYGGTGDLADVTRQGWFHRLLTKIWPL